MVQRGLADMVLLRLVDAYHRQPEGRFVLTTPVAGRTTHQITHPTGTIGVDVSLLEDLIARRLVSIEQDAAGAPLIRITLRGFDYAAYYPQGE